VTTLAAYLAGFDTQATVGTTPIPSLEDYLGLTPTAAERAKLKAWYSAATEWCDNKLSSRDFTADPPDGTVIGVYEFVRYLHDYDSRAAPGASKIKTGAREEDYATESLGGMVAAGRAAWPWLEPWCEDVSLFASGGTS
jgi:hypothetical protein